jgi:hypothetical protein
LSNFLIPNVVDRSEIVTLLGCGNAAGNAIPPYFVYPGKEMQSRWMDGSTPGAVGIVSDSGSADIRFSEVADFMYAAQASWHTSSFMITADVVLVF